MKKLRKALLHLKIEKGYFICPGHIEVNDRDLNLGGLSPSLSASTSQYQTLGLNSLPVGGHGEIVPEAGGGFSVPRVLGMGTCT
jgi:hypothetical protein